MWRRVSCAALGVAFIVLLCCPVTASAATAAPTPSPVTTVGTLARGTPGATPPSDVPMIPKAGTVAQCMGHGGVWLVVVTDVDTALVNECVDTANSWAIELQNAGVSVQRASDHTICQIGGFPQTCLASAANRFWQHFSALPTGDWQYAQLGPDEGAPQPGTLDGWCFGSQCALPKVTELLGGVNILQGIQTAPPTPTATPIASSSKGLAAVGVLLAVAVVAVLAAQTVRHARRVDTGRHGADAGAAAAVAAVAEVAPPGEGAVGVPDEAGVGEPGSRSRGRAEA